MGESEGLRMGRAAVARVFSEESKLKEFLRQVKDFGINLDACHFAQIESIVRVICPPVAATAIGRPAVGSYQGLPGDEDDVLDHFFKQELDQAKRKYKGLFK
jgi:hypothetical protein